MERIKEATLSLLTGNMREKTFCFLMNDLSNIGNEQLPLH